jgi:hypothetical protein
VVDDKEVVRQTLAVAGIQPLPGPFLDFLDQAIKERTAKGMAPGD